MRYTLIPGEGWWPSDATGDRGSVEHAQADAVSAEECIRFVLFAKDWNAVAARMNQ